MKHTADVLGVVAGLALGAWFGARPAVPGGLPATEGESEAEGELSDGGTEDQQTLVTSGQSKIDGWSWGLFCGQRGRRTASCRIIITLPEAPSVTNTKQAWINAALAGALRACGVDVRQVESLARSPGRGSDPESGLLLWPVNCPIATIARVDH